MVAACCCDTMPGCRLHGGTTARFCCCPLLSNRTCADQGVGLPPNPFAATDAGPSFAPDPAPPLVRVNGCGGAGSVTQSPAHASGLSNVPSVEVSTCITPDGCVAAVATPRFILHI